MKASDAIWKERLKGSLPEPLGSELDQYESEIELRKLGKIEEKVFAETRLRRGSYGQRYDNGHRSDGKDSRPLAYQDKPTKGPGTMWDAPGMQRIKIPFGGLNPAQLEVMADLAEEYSDGIAHVTTRQDFQLHFIHIENAPTVMRRLASVGITTREACGNSVRNVTACPLAGVCRDEAFDVSPYALACARYLMGHPDTVEFGRKFKPAYSGCAQHACGLTQMHDIGFTAAVRQVDGKLVRGFKIVVGGGLGPVPRQARVLIEFAPLEEMLPLTQAVAKVFAKHGEKKNRNAARIKFLVDKWGIEKFREEVFAVRRELKDDPRWRQVLQEAEQLAEGPLHPPGEFPALNGDEKLRGWIHTNVRDQRQAGYVTAGVTLPLGDITAHQLRALADIVRRYTRGTIRTTVEQNFLIRWVSKADVPALYADLAAADLGDPGAGNIVDIVACPGTDTCKLGISSSRGLGGELRNRLLAKSYQLDEAVKDLHIKISGCFNSCGCHHVADLGFYGVSRTVNGFKVPYFQVVVGGQWENNAGSYGLPIVAVPSKRAPEAVDRVTEYFVTNRRKDEKFYAFVKRVGKAPIRALLEPLGENLPSPQAEPGLYSDWGDPRQYSIGDIGMGECAGEVVTRYQFEMTAAERLVFEAGLQLDRGEIQTAGQTAYAAFQRAAKALVQVQYDDVGNDPEEIMAEFKERFFDTQLFRDPFVGPKFANYYFAAHAGRDEKFTETTAHHRITEAQLFIEAVHNCYNKVRSTPGAHRRRLTMELQHLIVKIPVEGPLRIDPAKVVDVFHGWVANQTLPGVLLVDVAELLHVPDGPGVVIVGLEADCALDHTSGVWGVLHRRKNVLPGSNAERIAQAFQSAAQVGARLEAAFPGELKFSRTEFELIVNDRGIAPNTAASYAAGVPEIEAGLKALFGHDNFRLSRHDREPRSRFGVSVASAVPIKVLSN